MHDAGPLHPGASVQIQNSLSADDVERVTELLDAAAEEDDAEPLSEQARLRLRRVGESPGRHFLMFAGNGSDDGPDDGRPEGRGRLVGYAYLDRTDLGEGPGAELVVHPAHRRHGYGRALVAAVTEASGNGPLRLWAHGDHPAGRALAGSMGFHEIRRLLQLRRSLAAPLPPLRLPDGVQLRPFRPGEDDAAWLELNARAFADHPEQGRWTSRDLADRMAEPWFDADSFLIAERRQQMVGFHWIKTHPAADGDDALGEVYVLGIDPQAQRDGLGRAVTLAGLRRMHDMGLPTAMLYVEADNAPALRLYTGLGFTQHSVDVMFLHHVPVQ